MYLIRSRALCLIYNWKKEEVEERLWGIPWKIPLSLLQLIDDGSLWLRGYLSIVWCIPLLLKLMLQEFFEFLTVKPRSPLRAMLPKHETPFQV